MIVCTPAKVTTAERLYLWLGWPIYLPLFALFLLHEAYRWWRPGTRSLPAKLECGWRIAPPPDQSLGTPFP